jgi:hypothetical protein
VRHNNFSWCTGSMQSKWWVVMVSLRTAISSWCVRRQTCTACSQVAMRHTHSSSIIRLCNGELVLWGVFHGVEFLGVSQEGIEPQGSQSRLIQPCTVCCILGFWQFRTILRVSQAGTVGSQDIGFSRGLVERPVFRAIMCNCRGKGGRGLSGSGDTFRSYTP